MRNQEHITLVIPARNEQRALAALLPKVPVWVDRVVVADNGSSDGTSAVARALGAEVVSEARRGYGAACARGADHAIARGTDLLVFMDADGSDDPREMIQVVDPLLCGAAELVVGRRTGVEAMPPHQRLGTQVVCGVLSRGFGVRVTDLGPFRALSVATFRELDMRDRAFGWTAEMQARALRLGKRVREVDVSWRPGLGHSEITGSLPGVLRAGRDLLGCSLREIAIDRLEKILRRLDEMGLTPEPAPSRARSSRRRETTASRSA